MPSTQLTFYPDTEGQHPIHLAVEAEQGSLEAVMSLSEKGVKLNSRSQYPILKFCGSSIPFQTIRTVISQYILPQRKGSIPLSNSSLINSNTPIFVPRVSVVISATCHIADMKFESAQAGQEPIHLAAREGHDGVIKILAKHGVDIKSEGGDPSLNLHNALVIADIILDSQGQQPIHLAAQNGHLSAIKALADLDADLQVASKYLMRVLEPISL